MECTAAHGTWKFSSTINPGVAPERHAIVARTDAMPAWSTRRSPRLGENATGRQIAASAIGDLGPITDGVTLTRKSVPIDFKASANCLCNLSPKGVVPKAS
jgi:hypothetical protein